MTRISVKPIYGWGWFDPSTNLLDVPAPFTIETTRVKKDASNIFGAIMGIIIDQNHEYYGMWTLLSRRSVQESSADFNVRLYKQKPPFFETGPIDPKATEIAATGFAQIPFE